MNHSFVLMPIGINRKKMRQGTPIMLKGNSKKSQEGVAMELEEVENPVLVSYKRNKKKDPTATDGYNLDLEPAGQTSGLVSNSDIE